MAENEKSLQRVEDCKHNLEGERCFTDGKSSETPRKAKECHDSKQAHGKAYVGFSLLSGIANFVQFISSVSDESYNDNYEDYCIEQKNGKYWTKKRCKENSVVTNKTAMGRERDKDNILPTTTT